MPTYDKNTIIRYVDGELPPEERQEFEADLQKDPSLAAEVALYEDLKATLQERLPRDDTGMALRSTLKEMNKNYFGSTDSQTSASVIPMHRPSATGAKRIPISRWLGGMAAAASVILAVVLLWPSSKNDLDGLGRTQMIGTTERGGNADSLLQQAAEYFNQQEFEKALPFLDKAVKADSSSQLALFYRGVAGWHTGAIEAARKDLEQVYKGGSLLQYEAAFYMALSYAKEKNKDAAKEWLKKIPEGTPVSEKAKELNEKIINF